MDLKNKRVIVTGASSGIGTAFSKKLVDKGAVVYGLARRIQKLNEIRQRLGESFIPVEMDVTDQDAIEAWVNSAFDSETLPDALINNAGLGRFGKVDEMSTEDWHTMIDTNLNGVFYLTRLIVPLMKQHPGTCHIINISSVAGLLGNPEISGYNATKFGLRGFSEALFKELRYDKIKVSTMFPGSIATEFFEVAAGGDTHSNMMQPGDVADTLIHLLETPNNLLINEVTLRPLNPKKPE
ncbi:SDR family oxidoreductase [Rhodohalobacter mucosus]|uniref:NAD-binding protein n=1 Tax=Rhodohalobacter mucosus TaxID=2079485 RepID=A0A316TVD5_9BACT|nr:SDR family oxidoreductase [Rhodohalobacter mucosus]PWN06422.1 NAD-binding protein [Rhodohalobacter mucosus]